MVIIASIRSPASYQADVEKRSAYVSYMHDLRGRSLEPQPQRVAIVISLDDLREKMREFILDCANGDTVDVWMQLTFETFLQWLKKRQDAADHETNARR